MSGTSTDGNGVDKVNLFYTSYDGIGCGTDYIRITALDNVDNDSPFDWNYSWTPPGSGSYCLKAEATDVAGNTEASPVVEGIGFVRAPEIQTSLQDGKKKLKTEISGLADFAFYDYRVTYNHGGIKEGYSGRIDLSGRNISSKEFVLGSCSSDGCTYFEGVDDIAVAVDVYTAGGSVYHLERDL